MPQSVTEISVGRVDALFRYPVKSMAAEPLTDAEVSWHGFVGDRRWAFAQESKLGNGFPWFTLRERADLRHYQPAFVDPASPDRSVTRITTPAGRTLDVTDPALRRELCDEPLQLIRSNRGVFDTFPLSLITTQTIESLALRTGMRLDVERFRPNIVVDAASGVEYPEDSWVGGVLRLGSLRMRVDKRDGRCVVITLDPQDQKRSPKVLRIVAQEREGCLGVYGTTVQPGVIAVGDEVVLEQR